MNMEKAEAAAKEIAEKTGRNVIAIQCNVTVSQSVNDMISKYEEEL